MEEEMTRFYTSNLPSSNQMVAVTFPFNSLSVESHEIPSEYLHLQPFQYNRKLLAFHFLCQIISLIYIFNLFLLFH